MQLVANVCELNVVLPHTTTGSVLLGAAILGQYSFRLKDNAQTDVAGLWDIMVSLRLLSLWSILSVYCALNLMVCGIGWFLYTFIRLCQV